MPSPPPTDEPSATPRANDTLQATLGAWLAKDGDPKQLLIKERWVNGSELIRFGYDQHGLPKDSTIYFALFLGARALSNGEAIVFVGMEDKAGNRYFVPFRAGVGSAIPQTGHVEFNYTLGTFIGAQETGDYNIVVPNSFVTDVNGPLLEAIAQVWVPKVGNAFIAPWSGFAGDGPKANRELRTWALAALKSDVSHGSAPWFINDSDINLTNYDSIPTFNFCDIPNSFTFGQTRTY